MKNRFIVISLVFMLAFMPAVTLAEETTELREAKIDIKYTPQKDGTDLRIELENTGEIALEAMTLKIFYDNELSESSPVSIKAGESEAFRYKIPGEKNVVESVLSRGGLGIKFSKSTLKTTGQELSTTVHFSEEFFTGRGDVYDFKFDFEMQGKPVEIEQNTMAEIELKLKNTGTMDLGIDLEAESKLRLNYPEYVSLDAERTKNIYIEVFAGSEIGEYEVSITGKTETLTKTLPVPVKINVIEKPPTEPMMQIINIIHEDMVYIGEESRVIVQMKNTGLGGEIKVKLDVPEGWEVQPPSEKKKINRFETVDVVFYILPKTPGKEEIAVNTNYVSGEFEIQVGRSFFSYILMMISVILLILILILTYELRYEFRKDNAAAVLIMLVILYVTCEKSFIPFLWVLAFLIAVPVLLYSYYMRRRAKEKGGLEYIDVE